MNMSEELEVKAVEVVEAIEAAELEVKAVEADDLDLVKQAVADVQGENLTLKATAEELEAKSLVLEKELQEKSEKLEELEAKASAPMVITPSRTAKEEDKMDHNEQVKTFMSEGIEGLRSKAADLQITVDAQGGYALPEELRQEIIRLEKEVSPIRQVASVATASTSDVRQLVSIGDAASGWVGETSARAQTNAPELAQRVAVFGEVFARPRIYQHMLEDGFFNAESWLASEVARQFAEAEGNAFLSGDGSNKPVGILNGLDLTASAAANDTTGAYQVLESAEDGVLGATDVAIIDFLRDVVLSCKTGYLPNAKFMMNRATHGILAGLKDANGSPYINPDISQAAGKTLFGHEIIINEDMDSAPVSTGSKAVIMFGDFARAYQIVDRTGVTMLRDPYTNPGSVMFYTRKRVGSMVLDASALKVVTVSKA
jgi:HK97 family phage major capsid protein